MSHSSRIRKPFRDREFWQVKAIKKHLLRQSNVCALCGKEILSMNDATADHIVPVSKGGMDIPSNIQLAHEACNRKRGNQPAAKGSKDD